MAERLDSIVLRKLRVRPIRDAAERASWDGLMEAHHCLGFRSPFGAALRHVAELPGSELGVAGSGPFGEVPVVGHGGAAGHPVLLAETFVDLAPFAGTCHLVAG